MVRRQTLEHRRVSRDELSEPSLIRWFREHVEPLSGAR
jgi:hypothetical protein